MPITDRFLLIKDYVILQVQHNLAFAKQNKIWIMYIKLMDKFPIKSKSKEDQVMILIYSFLLIIIYNLYLMHKYMIGLIYYLDMYGSLLFCYFNQNNVIFYAKVDIFLSSYLLIQKLKYHRKYIQKIPIKIIKISLN